jgi:hypothetical protein
MYANFYDVDDNCLFSVEVRDEHSAEHLADKLYATDDSIEDWTITKKPMSKQIRGY